MKLREIANKIIADRTKYQLLMFNHILQEIVLNDSINEEVDLDKREEVLQKISNGDWETPQNPESFKDSMDISKHKEMLTPYSTSELAQMKLYKLNGFNIGFALKKRNDGYEEIVAVHNNEPYIKDVGTSLVKAAIKNGGCYLDHFDGYLSKFYNSLGFEEIGRDEFDVQYDKDGIFRNKYGKSDIIYRKHKNCK